MKPVIRTERLSKKFKIYSNPRDRLVEWVTFGRRQRHEDFWALRDICFEVRRGDCLGIIGSNGAGKSTLLKILSGALHPSAGKFQVQGRVLSLLELGTGFNAELTGRQNLFNSANLLSLPTGYMQERIAQIEEFAELGEFFDRPIKLYSSGMYVRLAFSMFAFLEPDVLIIDEALSVGDVFFQQKSYARMREKISGGTACLFVSHDMNAVLNLCSEAILLDGGRIIQHGDPREVVSLYLGSVGTRKRGSTGNPAPGVSSSGPRSATPSEIIEHDILRDVSYFGAGGLRVEALRVTDRFGRDTLHAKMEEELAFHFLVRANEHVRDPSVGLDLFDRFGNRVFSAGTRHVGYRLPDLEPGERLVVQLDLRLNVEPGEYVFGIGASEPSEEGPNIGYIHHRADMLGPIVVTFDTDKIMPFYGIAKLPMTVRSHCVFAP